MDKNSIIGLVLIGLIFVGFYFINKPSEAQIAEMKKKQDSIAQVKYRTDSLEKAQALLLSQEENQISDTTNQISNTLSNEQKDSIENFTLTSKYGIFKSSANGEEKFTKIENEKIIITFTNRGGKIYSVELKDYKTYYQEPLILFVNDNNSVFGMEMIAEGKPLITNEMFFTPSSDEQHIVVKDKPLTFNMKLLSEENKYIEYKYTISPDDYMIDFDINFVGLTKELESNSFITLRWNSLVPSLERGRDWESNNTTIYMRMADDEIEYLSETKDADNFNSRGAIQWVAFKQQFFSSILIAKDKLDNPTVSLKKIENKQSPYLKEFNSEFTFALNESEKQEHSFNFYFGPNKFSSLKEYDLKLEKVVPLGWGIFGWVNRFLIIPIFNWLGGFIGNYGIIILILTIIIKVIIFPFTYKSYMSSAKMRVLKPQVDALSEKYPPGKELEKQQATMALYKKAGANPMGGCLPMLFQIPVLFAMFRFFPASIELRQKSFLWANDLSTYDAIVEWSTNIPILSGLYGNHISLFTLLMAASMIISTKMTSSSQPTSSNMPGMKMMMYLMPLFMVLWFNKYSSGLSYYYFLANLITIIQTWVMQKFIVDEKKVLAQMEANKKKVKPKSKWQQRLEDATKQQQQIQRQRQNKK